MPAQLLAGVDACDGMVIVLEAAGTKMTLSEMAAEMLRQGWRTKARQPSETLRVALRRDEANRVVRVERGYYDLRSRQMWNTPEDMSLVNMSRIPGFQHPSPSPEEVT